MKLALVLLLLAAALWLLRRALPWDGEMRRLTAAEALAMSDDDFERWLRTGLRTVSDLQDGVDYLAEFRRERLPWERVG